MARILWINPLGSTKFDEPIRAELERVKRANTEIEVRSLPSGPHHLEYRSYEAVLIPGVLEATVQAEREGFDATIVGCFFDSGVEAARELAERMHVVGPCEAALNIATGLGDRFALITGQRKWTTINRERLHRYGKADRCAAIKLIDLRVHDFHDQRSTASERAIAACREAVEHDGADVCVLGCTIEYGMYERMQEAVGVPVVDAVAAPLKYAEFLADLAGLGWVPSKVGMYEPPPADELQRFGLAGQFGLSGELVAPGPA